MGGVIINVFVMTAVDRGFDPQSDQTKNKQFGDFCFSSKNAALRSKTKDWLTRSHDNLSVCRDTSTTVDLGMFGSLKLAQSATYS